MLVKIIWKHKRQEPFRADCRLSFLFSLRLKYTRIWGNASRGYCHFFQKNISIRLGDDLCRIDESWLIFVQFCLGAVDDDIAYLNTHVIMFSIS